MEGKNWGIGVNLKSINANQRIDAMNFLLDCKKHLWKKKQKSKKKKIWTKNFMELRNVQIRSKINK